MRSHWGCEQSMMTAPLILRDPAPPDERRRHDAERLTAGIPPRSWPSQAAAGARPRPRAGHERCGAGVSGMAKPVRSERREYDAFLANRRPLSVGWRFAPCPASAGHVCGSSMPPAAPLLHPDRRAPRRPSPCPDGGHRATRRPGLRAGGSAADRLRVGILAARARVRSAQGRHDIWGLVLATPDAAVPSSTPRASPWQARSAMHRKSARSTSPSSSGGRRLIAWALDDMARYI